MAKKPQATWGGRFSGNPSELMIRFSESVSFDRRLAPFDVLGSKAHAAMLCHVGLLTVEERDAIQGGLDAILREIERGEFQWDETLEDVHMNIEQALSGKVPAASKLHTGRSRNDQVATDMRLFFKSACAELENAIKSLLAALVEKAGQHCDIIVPGYTHLRRAQPVSLAYHWLAYVEMFNRDGERFRSVAEHANTCPLGSGALAGSTLPLDREFTAHELGFVDKKGRPQLTRNSLDAVADRDLFLEFATACAICGTHFSRMAEDLIIWSSEEFGYLELPEAFTTGSSLMPQKKNPDSLELIRGKAARLQGNAQTLFTLLKGLPMTYNRDLQEDKQPVFDSLDHTMISIQVLSAVVAGLTIRADVCKAAAADPQLLATDLVDYLVQRQVPFREAHHAVGKLVALAEQVGLPMKELTYAQARQAHPKIGTDWYKVFHLETALKNREKPGMPGPQQIRQEISRWLQHLAEG